MEVNGESLLAHLLGRLGQAELVDDIVVATGPGEENEPIREEAIMCGVDCPYIESDEDDVLGRFIEVAEAYGADVIVRITGDCPLVDPAMVDRVITALGDNDFASNVVNRTFPRGMDVEVMHYDTLLRLRRLATDDYSKEHVCVYVYSHDEFSKASVEDDYDNHLLPNGEECRWCVDTPEDFERIGEMLADGGGYEDLLRRFYG